MDAGMDSTHMVWGMALKLLPMKVRYFLQMRVWGRTL